ncbi:hypothetical protein ACQY0O_006054 [Thecaphora frezii]
MVASSKLLEALLRDYPLSTLFAVVIIVFSLASLAPSARVWQEHRRACRAMPKEWQAIPTVRLAGWTEAVLTALGVPWVVIHNLVKKPVLTQHGIARMSVVEFRRVLSIRTIIYISSPELISWFVATERLHPKRSSQVPIGSDRFGCHVFNSTGDDWIAHRRIMNVALGSAIDYAALDGRCRQLVEKATTQSVWDAGALLQRFAVDVLGSCLFGIDFEALENPVLWFTPMKRIEHMLEPSFSDWFTLLRRFDPAAKSAANLAFREQQLQRFVEAVRAQQEKQLSSSPGARCSLVEAIARDQNKAKPTLNEARIKENLEFLFFSGHHSVTLALCHIVHQLAINKELYDQVSCYVNQSASETSGNDESDANLVRRLAIEALRFHPPIEESPDYVTNTPLWLPTHHFLPSGTTLRFSALAAQHHPETYPRPSVFDPARHTDVGARSATWIPFGLGQRRCPAQKLAMEVIEKATRALVSNLEWKLEGERHRRELRFKRFLGTEPDRLVVRFEKSRRGSKAVEEVL